MKKTLLLGLLRALGAWVALTAAMTLLVHLLTAAPLDGSFGVGLLAGTVALPALGLLRSAAQRWRERATLRNGSRGQPPVDGRQVVLVGSLQATGPLLQAPLDGARCLVYSYDVKVYRGRGKGRSLFTVARGAGLTPSVIVTPAGRFKLLVVPDLQASALQTPRAQCITHFEAYVGRSTFIEGKASAQELLDRWGDDDGAYRSDVAFEPLAGVNTDGWLLQQQHVAPGAPVCVIGRFDQRRGGVVPAADGAPTRLIVGDLAEVAGALRTTALWHAFFGLLLAAVPVLVVWKAWQDSIPQ